jgi:hypothetical protein
LLTADPQSYNHEMIIIRFTDAQSERRALGWLAGRFSFKSWATGEMMLSEEALPYLAREGIRFQVEGPPTYKQLVPAFRDPASTPVQ